MRIPIYTSGSAMTSEAPGRSFRTRANAQPFVQQARGQGAIASAVIGQAAEFTAMRYKAARETQINEKLLAGEEVLREEARNLSMVKTGDLRNVFNEGGKEEEGLWAQSTKSTREKLLEDVKDLESKRILTDRFNQMELTQRFSLRNTIDQKIESANTAARAARANTTMQSLASVTSAAEFDLIASNFGVDSIRMGQLGLGNPEALKKQEFAVIYSAISSNLAQAINGSDTPSRDLENIRLAIRDDDPNLAGKNQLQLALLKKLPLGEQAKILSSLGAGASFIDGASAEEKKLVRINAEYVKQAGNTITSYTSLLQKGMTLPEGAINQLTGLVDRVATNLNIGEEVELREGLADLTYIQELSSSVKKVTNLQDLDNMIMRIEAGDTMGGEGIQEREQLGLEFLRGFRANMDKQLTSNPIGYAATTGSVKINPIDLSKETIEDFQRTGEDTTGVQQRIAAAIQVQGHYDIKGPINILTPTEASAYAPSLNKGTAVEKLTAINNITQLFGDFAPAVMAQIAPSSPLTSHVAGLLQDGLFGEAEIILNGISEIEANGSPLVGADKFSVRETTAEAMGVALELLPSDVQSVLKGNISNTAEAYYAEVLSRRVNKEFDDKLWGEAIRVASGFNPRTGKGGIQEVRGVATLLPPNRDADEFETALDKISMQAFNSISRGLGVIDEATFEDIQGDDDYTLQVLGRAGGKLLYGIVYGEYGSEQYGMIVDDQNEFISFTAEDLITSSRNTSLKIKSFDELVKEALDGNLAESNRTELK